MEYTISPKKHELEEARRIVQESIEICKAVREKEESLRISLSWTEDEFIKEKMNGSSGESYSSTDIKILFNSDVEGWRKEMKASVIHEYAHAWFYEHKDVSWNITFNWQQIILDAHAQLFTERTLSEYDEPMKDHIEKEELAQKWPEIKESLSKELEKGRDLFYGGENFEKWTGYTVAYMIGQKLLEKHELEDFPDLKRSDVLEAGEKLFN